MTTTTIIRADELHVGDVILTPAFDVDGMSVDLEFKVTKVRVFQRSVAIAWADGPTRLHRLAADLELRVIREG